MITKLTTNYKFPETDMRTVKSSILITLLSLWFAGCTVYKIDIQQGNTLDQEQIDKIKVGMTHKQVRFVLGTPTLQDPFHPERWDYIYSFKPGNGELFKQRLTLFFQQNKLVRIENKMINPGGKGPKGNNNS